MFKVNTILAENEKVVAEIVFGSEELIFRGHFPNNPVLPGFVLIDVAVQIFQQMYHKLDKQLPKKAISAKFFQQILPGDSVRFECQINQILKDNQSVIKNTATCFTKDSIVAKINL